MVKKKFLLALIIMIGIMILPIIVNASNENVQILQESSTDYIIYVKGHLNEELEFAFSNNKNADKTALTYKTSALDSTSAKNNVVYIDNYTTENDFLWVKDTKGNFILEAVAIDLTNALTENELTSIQKITKVINVDTTQTVTTEKTVGTTTTTTTVGKLVIKDSGKFTYQIVKLPNTNDYNNFMSLAERISKFNSSTDFYTKLEVYEEFNTLFTNLSNNLSGTTWTTVTNTEVLQPEDTSDGEQYIVWLKNTDTDTLDVQFLTSKKVETEEKIVEEVRTKLPVTYDNNTLLFVLGGVIIAIIIVALRIRSLKKKVK